jgi:hypothetical protein
VAEIIPFAPRPVRPLSDKQIDLELHLGEIKQTLARLDFDAEYATAQERAEYMALSVRHDEVVASIAALRNG